MGREGNAGRCYLPLRVPPPFAFSIVGLPDLEPQERAAAPVRCRPVFADKALVSSLQNLPPRGSFHVLSCHEAALLLAQRILVNLTVLHDEDKVPGRVL